MGNAADLVADLEARLRGFGVGFSFRMMDLKPQSLRTLSKRNELRLRENSKPWKPRVVWQAQWRNPIELDDEPFKALSASSAATKLSED